MFAAISHSRRPCHLLGRSFLHTARKHPFGVVLDIDGVLIRGRNAIPNAVEALNFLEQNSIPYCFLTNCGRYSEKGKCASLSRILDREIEIDRMIMAHSPLRVAMPESWKSSKRVLCVGDGPVVDIAKDYGYPHAVSAAEYSRHFPELVPDYHHQIIKVETDEVDHSPVAAIFLMADSTQWHRDLQICVDLLRSSSGHPHIQDEEGSQHVKLHVTNCDLVYAGAFKYPRFGFGAFYRCLNTLYSELHPRDELPDAVFYGKPHSSSYRYAEDVIKKQANKVGFDDVETIYAIGDNPDADVCGANAAGHRWRSVLTRTGCWQEPEAANHSVHPAHVVAADVLEAVQKIANKKQHK